MRLWSPNQTKKYPLSFSMLPLLQLFFSVFGSTGYTKAEQGWRSSCVQPVRQKELRVFFYFRGYHRQKVYHPTHFHPWMPVTFSLSLVLVLNYVTYIRIHGCIAMCGRTKRERKISVFISFFPICQLIDEREIWRKKIELPCRDFFFSEKRVKIGKGDKNEGCCNCNWLKKGNNGNFQVRAWRQDLNRKLNVSRPLMRSNNRKTTCTAGLTPSNTIQIWLTESHCTVSIYFKNTGEYSLCGPSL